MAESPIAVVETLRGGTGEASTTAAPGISPRDAWINFAYLSTWAYLIYGIGIATPYLKSDIGLTDFQAGLHGSAIAVGTLVAGVGVDRIARRFGNRWLFNLSILGYILGVLGIVLAPTLAVSLAGATVLGLAGGTLCTAVNINLSSADRDTSRRWITQANALSMVTAMAAPLVMSLAAQTLSMWRLALLLPIAAGLALTAARPGQAEVRSNVRLPRARLPRAYWLIWVLILFGVSIEFSVVFWGSSIVMAQTGTDKALATTLASLFVAGMFVGRYLLGRGLGGRLDPRAILVAGLVLDIVAVALVRVSGVTAFSALGLFLVGLGTAPLYPVSLAMAIDLSGRAKVEAAARATISGGLAVLVAPSALGLASDAMGVSNAWPIIGLMAVAGLTVLAAIPRPKA